MNKIVTISFIFILSYSCSKKQECIHLDTFINTTHRNSLHCLFHDKGFLIKSEIELKMFYDTLKCDSDADYVTPINFSKTWMIGYASTINYYGFKINAALNKDTCLKIITYNYILTEDTNSKARDNSVLPITAEILYCLIPSFPSDYKVVFNKEVRYEKLP